MQFLFEEPFRVEVHLRWLLHPRILMYLQILNRDKKDIPAPMVSWECKQMVDCNGMLLEPPELVSHLLHPVNDGEYVVAQDEHEYYLTDDDLPKVQCQIALVSSDLYSIALTFPGHGVIRLPGRLVGAFFDGIPETK